MTDFALKAVSFCGNLILNKVKSKMASNLKESDVTAQQFRDMIMNPLNKIRETLDGMALKDLKASANFLNQGINLLEKHFVEVGDTEEMKGTLVKRLAELNEVKFNLSSEDAQKSPTSGEDNSLITEAQEQFRLSAEYAVLAFSNSALELSDRVNAAKLNIIAAILKHIDEEKTSLTLCKGILKQLNATEEIISNCQVQFGKGTAAAFMKVFNTDERKELIQSVAFINRMVWDYAYFCQADDSYFTDWPLISLDPEHQLHPVLDYGIREICGGREISDDLEPWPHALSVTEDGKFLAIAEGSGVLEILPNGLADCVCLIPPRHLTESPNVQDHSAKPEQDVFNPQCAVSAHGKIFVSSSEMFWKHDKTRLPAAIYVHDSKGSFKYDFGRDVFTAESILTSMAINKDNELLVVDDHTNSLHAFCLDGTYLGKRASWEDHDGESHIAVTPDNHLFKIHGYDTIRIYDIGHRDKPLFISETKCPGIWRIAYDSARHRLYAFVYDYNPDALKVKIYDKDLNLEGKIKLSSTGFSPRGIAVTPTGLVAIVNYRYLIVI